MVNIFSETDKYLQEQKDTFLGKSKSKEKTILETIWDGYRIGRESITLPYSNKHVKKVVKELMKEGMDITTGSSWGSTVYIIKYR